MILSVSYLLIERVISIFPIEQQTYTEIDLIRTLISANLGLDGINPHIRFDLVTVDLNITSFLIVVISHLCEESFIKHRN